MILGFRKEFSEGQPTNFKEKILAHTKIHTIRLDKHHRWKAGRSIQFATGVRTKNYNQFLDGECKSVQSIKIGHIYNNQAVIIIVDRKVLTTDTVIELVKNDGFDNLDDFCKWFNKDFSGVIVHWTDLKY